MAVNRPSLVLFLALALLPIGCAATSDTSQMADGGPQGEMLQRPEWQVGDKWTFRWKAGTNAGEYTSRILAANDGGYTMGTGRERRYFTADYELISVVRGDGVVTEQHSPPLPIVKFPLRANMKWKQGEGLAASGST